jgi:hypothetical protein
LAIGSHYFNSVGGTIVVILGDSIQKDGFGYQEVLEAGFKNANFIIIICGSYKAHPRKP